MPFADFVSLHRELSEAPPFGSRSLLDRSPFVLRSSFVPPSFLLRSNLVTEAKKHRRDNEPERNKDSLNFRNQTFDYHEFNKRMSFRHISTDLASVVRLSALGRHMGLPLQAAV